MDENTIRIQRSFQDISDEEANSVEQTSLLIQMGWYGAFDWDKLLKSNRILLISEAGSGKTHECRAEQSKLWEKGAAAFYFELAMLATNDIRELLSSEECERFDAWRVSQTDIATIFLDSIDELKLTLGSFDLALKRLNKALSGQFGRVRVVITSRPTPMDVALARKYLPVPADYEFKVFDDDSFADIAMDAKYNNEKEDTENNLFDWRTVALMPLSEDQMRSLAEINGVTDADALLEDIRKRNAEDFVRRPQDLIELCADWCEHNRIRTHKDQVAYNISTKLKPRTDRREKAQLADDKAFEGASRLALAALLTRKLNIRHSAEADIAGTPGTALDPTRVLSDWLPEERDVLLERALFGFASYGRVRFHHRSVIEYLAALRLEYMLGNGMSLKAVKRILFAETAQAVKIVRPSMRSVAAWLAIFQPSIFHEISYREPNVLLDFGDPESLTIQQREEALTAYVQRYGLGGWRGLHVPRVQVHRFASAELSKTILELWHSGIQNLEVRNLLLELLAEEPIIDSSEIAFALVLDGSAAHGERLEALEILIQLNHTDIDKITLSMERQPDLWPDSLVKRATIRLYPENISAKSLCQIFARISEPENTISDLAYFWPESIAEIEVSLDYLNSMRIGLTDLVLETAEWNKNKWPHLVSTRQYFIPALAAICLRLINEGDVSEGVISSCVVASRLSKNEYGDDKPVLRLRQKFTEMTEGIRETAFWADDALIKSYQVYREPGSRYFEVSRNSLINLVPSLDRSWVLTGLSNTKKSMSERELMLEAALTDIRDDSDDLNDYMLALKQLVTDSDNFTSQIEVRLKPVSVDSTLARMEKKNKKRIEQEKRRKAKNRASWMLLRREILKDPKKAFDSDHRENTVWNLWTVMSRQRITEGRKSDGWSRRFIEQYFNSEIADELRLAMMDSWRNEQPTLRSKRPDKEKGTYLKKWLLGLSGIFAESEDNDWARNLSKDEAELALRYVPLGIGGFPSWFEDLVQVYPEAVEEVLGVELIVELDEIATPRHHSSLLQHVSYASPSVALIFISRLRAWLGENYQRVREGEDVGRIASRIRQVVTVLLKQDNSGINDSICLIANQQLVENNEPELVRVWLPILMKLDPAEGVNRLEAQLGGLEPEPLGPGVMWIGILFDNRHHHETQVGLNGSEFTPILLLRLLRIAYQYVRPSDDVEHEGHFTPDIRDYAECGRNALLDAFLNASGHEAWAIKIEMAEDPLFIHIRDRALFIAQEKSSKETDGVARKESEISEISNFKEVAPNTHDEMSSLLLDRIDDIEELLLRDDSPREVWQGIVEEKLMRREIARELRNTANNAYVVDQESVTADEKETDIRLRSTTSELEAVIELKLGNKNYSGRYLRDTISKQLVEKYMASSVCRSGCLLVTVAEDRTWTHPDTKESLDIVELEPFLQEEASRISREMGLALWISARVLDLRPRLPKEM